MCGVRGTSSYSLTNSLSHPFEAWQMFLPALLPMNKERRLHESYEGEGEGGSQNWLWQWWRPGRMGRVNGGGERGQGGLAVAGHDGLKDVNVVSHVMIIHSTYS